MVDSDKGQQSRAETSTTSPVVDLHDLGTRLEDAVEAIAKAVAITVVVVVVVV